MNESFDRARQLLGEFKGGDYVFGLGCFGELGRLTAHCGRRVSVVTSGVGKDWGPALHARTLAALDAAGLEPAGELIPGAAPNAPREDVTRIVEALQRQAPEAVVSVGGGSGIDAVKCALACLALGDVATMDDCFGVGQVTALLEAHGRRLLPLVAVQLAASSAAHLTKYSNITDLATGQKMLIVDEAVVPPKALFDYEMTVTMPKAFTMDGALDGIAHSLEAYMGMPADTLEKARPVCLLGIELIVRSLKAAVDDPADLRAREALGLGTDLGGYAIMIGGTNGAHLNSFSLVDLLPHGRACALMNPYYTVFFAPAIPEKLREVGEIYRRAGYTDAPLERLDGRDLGLAVAEAMLALSRQIGFPTTLRELDGFSEAHVARCLDAARNPKLESKLRNMPVPLEPTAVDTYMGSVLQAAVTGDLTSIRNME